MSCYTGSICHVWCHVTMALHTMPCYHGSTCHVWCHATMEIWCQAARNIIVLWGLKSLDPISKRFFFKYGYSFRTWNFTKICTLQAKPSRFFLYTSYIITEDGRFIDFTSSQYFKFNTWHMSLVWSMYLSRSTKWGEKATATQIRISQTGPKGQYEGDPTANTNIKVYFEHRVSIHRIQLILLYQLWYMWTEKNTYPCSKYSKCSIGKCKWSSAPWLCLILLMWLTLIAYLCPLTDNGSLKRLRYIHIAVKTLWYWKDWIKISSLQIDVVKKHGPFFN